MTADYEGPREARTSQPATNIFHKARHDLRPDRDGAGEGLGDLRQAVGKQRRYDALDPLGLQLPTRAFAELAGRQERSEEHTSELQSRQYLVCRLLLEKKKNNNNT